jgi:catechol 2,3-dioxygenase-like lactoylglutathione lyase family enzyme
VLADFTPTAFIPTTDPVRAKRFYVEVLGLDFVEESPFAVVVRSGQTTIRITPVEKPSTVSHTILGWTVPDIAAVLAGVVSRGVTPLRFDGLDQNEQGVWQSPSGAKVVWFSDPDRNTLSLTEL